MDKWDQTTQASLFFLMNPQIMILRAFKFFWPQRYLFTSFAAGRDEGWDSIVIGFLRIRGNSGLWSARRPRDHRGLLQMSTQDRHQGSEAGKHLFPCVRRRRVLPLWTSFTHSLVCMFTRAPQGRSSAEPMNWTSMQRCFLHRCRHCIMLTLIMFDIIPICSPEVLLLFHF